MNIRTSRIIKSIIIIDSILLRPPDEVRKRASVSFFPEKNCVTPPRKTKFKRKKEKKVIY